MQQNSCLQKLKFIKHVLCMFGCASPPWIITTTKKSTSFSIAELKDILFRFVRVLNDSVRCGLMAHAQYMRVFISSGSLISIFFSQSKVIKLHNWCVMWRYGAVMFTVNCRMCHLLEILPFLEMLNLLRQSAFILFYIFKIPANIWSNQSIAENKTEVGKKKELWHTNGRFIGRELAGARDRVI